ncbi:response regulator [Flavobacterium selenitireducens]|uniref:hypothetical protein n=1 Tax=Flavobacterium selenitireducens TaxID=2722704 RepID=UPI00168AB268|nr:hypothetical protein [Flavobacterium selenitireducens]MBD3583338.1 hypothetical protein [Flavobacterium selenitireducens]
MIKILYVGRHAEITETVLRLINARENWLGLGAATDFDAVSLFAQNDFDIVLLGCGLPDESERDLSGIFRAQKPEIIIIPHYGGGSGLLANEILSALSQ